MQSSAGKLRQNPVVQAGLTTWGRNEYIALAAATRIRKYGGSFIALGTVEYELDQLRTEHLGLVDVVVARFELKAIVRLLRSLVDEDISYRNLRGILEALLTTKTNGSLDFAKSIVFNSYAMAITPELKTCGNEGNRVKTFGEAARRQTHSNRSSLPTWIPEMPSGKLRRIEFPNMAVLSYQDLSPT